MDNLPQARPTPARTNSNGKTGTPKVDERTPSARGPRGARYKEKFQALREKYEQVTTTHESYQRQLDVANDKVKRLQEECNLLLDAVDIAVPAQPALLHYLAQDPIPEQYVSYQVPFPSEEGNKQAPPPPPQPEAYPAQFPPSVQPIPPPPPPPSHILGAQPPPQVLYQYHPYPHEPLPVAEQPYAPPPVPPIHRVPVIVDPVQVAPVPVQASPPPAAPAPAPAPAPTTSGRGRGRRTQTNGVKRK